MQIQQSILSQFLAGLAMLEQTVRACPPHLWDDASQQNPFWRIAYHALFYVHLYAQPTEHDFTPWEHSRENYQFLGGTPWPPHEKPPAPDPYSPEQILAYAAFCRQEISRQMPASQLDTPSGFHWLPFDKLELQIYSLRHLQQHVGELSGHLLTAAGVEIDWVGMGEPADG